MRSAAGCVGDGWLLGICASVYKCTPVNSPSLPRELWSINKHRTVTASRKQPRVLRQPSRELYKWVGVLLCVNFDCNHSLSGSISVIFKQFHPALGSYRPPPSSASANSSSSARVLPRFPRPLPDASFSPPFRFRGSVAIVVS